MMAFGSVGTRIVFTAKVSCAQGEIPFWWDRNALCPFFCTANSGERSGHRRNAVGCDELSASRGVMMRRDLYRIKNAQFGATMFAANARMLPQHQTIKKRPRRSVTFYEVMTCWKRLRKGLASLMRPDDAASNRVRCGGSRYAAVPTQTAAIIAALRARRHYTSDFRTGFPAPLAAFKHKNHRAEAPICQGRNGRETDMRA
ncbi:MAG: hypothetical protein WCD75_09155 [Rhodoplanes sp.]